MGHPHRSQGLMGGGTGEWVCRLVPEQWGEVDMGRLVTPQAILFLMISDDIIWRYDVVYH